MATESTVLGYVSRQLVVVAENNRFAITSNGQLRRNGSVEGPHRQRTLIRKIRVEFGMNALTVIGINFCAFLRGVNVNLRSELIKALVSPILSRRTAFHRTKTTAQRGVHGDRSLIGHR